MPQIQDNNIVKSALFDMLKSWDVDEPIYVTKNGYGDMVIMSMEIYERTMKQLAVYRELEISEQHITDGRVKDARASLASMREKYGL